MLIYTSQKIMNSLFECAALAILRTLTNDGKSPKKGAVRSGNRYKPTDTINREPRAANLPRCLVSMIVEEVTKANHNTLMREIRLLRNLSKKNIICNRKIYPSQCNHFRRILVSVSSSLNIPVWEIIHRSRVNDFGRGLFEGHLFQITRRKNAVDNCGRLNFAKINGHMLTPFLKYQQNLITP